MKVEIEKSQIFSDLTYRVEYLRKYNRHIFYGGMLILASLVVLFFGLKWFLNYSKDKKITTNIDKKIILANVLTCNDSISFHVDHRKITVQGRLVSNAKKHTVDSLLRTIPDVRQVINGVTILKQINIDELDIESHDMADQIPILLEKARQGFLTGDELAFTVKKIILYFDPNVAAVTNEHQQKLLNGVLQIISVFSEMKLIIRGYADDGFDWNYNKRLSKNRAQTAAEYLISNGIPSTRLQIEYYGDQVPDILCQTQTERWKNRRTEFEIQEIQSK